jgi:hypothetical protein
MDAGEKGSPDSSGCPPSGFAVSVPFALRTTKEALPRMGTEASIFHQFKFLPTIA